jgi:sporulation protein YlmC with PRC-barrel domain
MKSLRQLKRAKADSTWLQYLVMAAVLIASVLVVEGMWRVSTRMDDDNYLNPPLGPRCYLSEDQLIGDIVIDPQGNTLGAINDVVLDRRLGVLHYALVSPEGFLGNGDEVIPVPWHAMSRNYERNAFVLNVTKDDLKMAPRFFKDKAPDLNDPAWDGDYQQFYENIEMHRNSPIESPLATKD